ncbi:MAG: cysteine desulfurase-like protein [Gemmatimonadota bacterium]|nr:cysteine desulfurase-like protein [Gemmatimonadota bacterium]
MDALSATAVAPVDLIRSHFPALERVHRGQPVAYFDGPGGTQVPRAVADAMTGYLLRHNANTHWAYPSSAETDAIIDESRLALADFLGARPTEIAFGANMTSLTFHLGRALGRRMAAGDEIIVTELDHHANSDPWRELARDHGLVVRTARMIAESGQLDWADLESKLSSRTRLIAMGAASNAIGTINDVARAVALAREIGALSFIDAVHYAPHVLVNVRSLGCDFLACSAYKFYGPHIGVLYGREELLASLDIPRLVPAPSNAPDRIETGTQNHEGIAGAAAAVDFLGSLATGETRRERLATVFATLHVRGTGLFARLWRSLASMPGVTLYGPPATAPRTPTIGFTVHGVRSEEVARRLAGRGIFASHGDFYALTVIERLGLGEEGLVRAGCACYTSPAEVDRLITAVGEISGV